MATSISDSMMRAAQIDYLTRQVTAPKYKFLKVPMNNIPSGGSAIDPSASVLLEWKLPTRVYNLARSYISYNLNAAIPATAANSNVSHEDTFDLGNSISFGAAGGTDLVNLNFLPNYQKINRKITTPLDDFLGNDDMSGLYKSNAPASGNFVPGGSVYNNNGAAAGFQSSDNYNECAYMRTGSGEKGPPGIVSAGTPMNRYRQYPLGAFTGTLLGVDRDFYSPVEQYLRINAGPGNKMAFATLNAQSPATASSYACTSLRIDNVYLYLCVEQNQAIIDSIMQSTAEGQMRYRIPFTTAFRNLGGSAGSATNIQIQLSQQYGKRLKRILHTVYNPNEQLNTAYDTDNFNGLKIASYQTFMDSTPIQERSLSCARPSGVFINQDDWLENRKYLDTRSVYLSKEMYALNWFHIDSWIEPLDSDGSNIPDVNKDEGLLMDTVKQWQFSATNGSTAAGAGLVHYTFAEFTREILITPSGPVYI